MTELADKIAALMPRPEGNPAATIQTAHACRIVRSLRWRTISLACSRRVSSRRA